MLYDDFDTTTISKLETRNKTFNEIQSILQSKEAKILVNVRLEEQKTYP